MLCHCAESDAVRFNSASQLCRLIAAARCERTDSERSGPLELTDDSATVSVPAQQAGPSPLVIRVGDNSYTLEPTDGPIIIGREDADRRQAGAGGAEASRREELKLSQRTLAREKIVNAGTLISFEKGRSWPHKSTQAKLERVLGWDPGTIGRLRDDPAYNPVGAEPGETTEVMTTTVQAPLMAEAIELAL